MYLSRITFRDPNHSVRLLHNEYRLHQMIWELVPNDPAQKRTFLYRLVAGNPPMVYVLSQDWLMQDHAVFEVESKPFAPVIQRGDQLGFTVRVNPVVAKSNENGKVGGNGKRRSSRHDVVMNEKLILRQKGATEVRMTEVVHDAGSKWLLSRAEAHGFSVNPETLCFDTYTQRELMKAGAKHPIKLSTLDISGHITVQDPEQFLNCLVSGFGPAKGFGCGLFLVRPLR